jgi:signal transduction histidine kinase
MVAVHEDNAVWNVLCVSSELFSNDMTRLVLERMTFLGKKVRVFDVKSIDEAKKEFENNKDIAVVLIDIDHDKTAAYGFIHDIRDKYHNHRVRVVLRIGYPVILPCKKEIENYNIDGYIPKEVIADEQVEITVMTSLRGYHQVLSVENMLSSLAGSIAHEMRSPLWQVQGNLNYVCQNFTELNNTALSFLNDASRAITNGLKIIDMTMDSIKQKPINKNSFELFSALDICNEAVSDYAYKEAKYRDKVSVSGADFQILADPVLVKYILYNLIGNALYYVQHTPNATIVISIFAATRQIQVRDTGPGIPSENISKLFDSFFTSGKEGGTGLGLAYCKRTMKALDGDIYCESELGEYTAFRLSFPDVAVQTQKIA